MILVVFLSGEILGDFSDYYKLFLIKNLFFFKSDGDTGRFDCNGFSGAAIAVHDVKEAVFFGDGGGCVKVASGAENAEGVDLGNGGFEDFRGEFDLGHGLGGLGGLGGGLFPPGKGSIAQIGDDCNLFLNLF